MSNEKKDSGMHYQVCSLGLENAVLSATNYFEIPKVPNIKTKMGEQ